MALLDTAIDTGTPALTGQVISTIDVLGRPNADGASTVHGTEMASLIAARPQSETSVYGVAVNAEILSIPIVGQFAAEPSAIVSALREAVRAHAQVIALPYGTSSWPSEVQDALRDAVAQGAVPVQSAGNRGQDSAVPPIDGTLVAASLNLTSRTLEPYSGPATTRGFVVPGGEASPGGHRVAVLAPGNRTESAAGTSVSTALLAGAVAWLQGTAPRAESTQVVACLKETAQDVGPTGPDAEYGFGIPDLAAAARCLDGGNGGAR